MSQIATHVEDQLLDFAYGELSSADAKAVQGHLDACEHCRGELADIQGVRRVMSQVPPAPAPQAGLESLLAYAEQAARRAQAGPPPKPSWWRRYMAPLTGACAVMVVGVVAHQVNERVGTVEELRDKAVLAQGAPAAAATPAVFEQSPEPAAELKKDARAEPAAAAARANGAKEQARAPLFGAASADTDDAFADEAQPEGAAAMPRGAIAEGPARRSRGVETATNAMPAPLEESAKDAEAGFTTRAPGARAVAEPDKKETNKKVVARPMAPLGGESRPAEVDVRGQPLEDDAVVTFAEKGGGGGLGARSDMGGGGTRGTSLDGLGSGASSTGRAGGSAMPASPSMQANAPASAPPPPVATAPAPSAPAKPMPKQTAQAPSAAAAREVEAAYGDSSRAEERQAARDEAAKAERTPFARKGKAEKEEARAEAEAENAYRSAQARALSDAARQAYGDNDRELEARLLRQAVPLAGADRPLLSGLLVRLCSAEYALGRTAQGDAACAQVTEQFRGTAAARIAERQRAEHHAALQGGARPAARQAPASAPASADEAY